MNITIEKTRTHSRSCPAAASDHPDGLDRAAPYAGSASGWSALHGIALAIACGLSLWGFGLWWAGWGKVALACAVFALVGFGLLALSQARDRVMWWALLLSGLYFAGHIVAGLVR